MPIAKFQLEDGRVARFEVPEGTTPEQANSMIADYDFSQHDVPKAAPAAKQPPITPASALAASYARVPPTPDSWTDTGLTVASNLAKGVVDTAMILPNLANQAVAGPQYLYKGISDTFKGNPTDHNFKPYQPFYSSSDVVDDSLIDYKPQTTAGKIAEIPARLAGNMVAPTAINKAGNKMFPGERVTAADKAAQSSTLYDKVEKSGAMLDDSVFTDYLAKANAIRPKGRIQQATGARDAFDDALDEVGKVASVKGMTVNEVKQLDSRLTELAENARDAGASTPTSRLINQLKHMWRDAVEDASNKGLVNVKDAQGNLVKDPAIVKDWQSAIKDYSTAMRTKDIELIIERAKLTDNPASTLKTGFRNLYLKIQQGKARGYTPEQVKAIKKAAETGITTGIARVVGSRLNPIVALSSTGIDSGIVAGAASKAARDFATRAQMGRANNVLDTMVGPRVQDPQMLNWANNNQDLARRAALLNLSQYYK